MRAVLPGVTAASRTVTLLPDGLRIRDVVTGVRQTYAWTWVTDAAVEVDGGIVRLTQGGSVGEWTFTLPTGSTISVADAPFDGPTDAPARIVTVRVPAATALDLTATLTITDAG
jgi:hypothetical protein